jgi:hypothetical protein
VAVAGIELGCVRKEGDLSAYKTNAYGRECAQKRTKASGARVHASGIVGEGGIGIAEGSGGSTFFGFLTHFMAKFVSVDFGIMNKFLGFQSTVSYCPFPPSSAPEIDNTKDNSQDNPSSKTIAVMATQGYKYKGYKGTLSIGTPGRGRREVLCFSALLLCVIND